MRTIVVIEPFSHQEVLYEWLDIWQRVAGVNVVVFCRLEIAVAAPIYLQGAIGVKWFFLPEQGMIPFLQSHQKKFIDADAVIWLTIASRFDYLQAVPVESRLIVAVHNSRSLLKPRLHFSMMALLKWGKYLLRGQPYYRRLLLRRAPLFAFPTTAMQTAAHQYSSQYLHSAVWPFNSVSTSFLNLTDSQGFLHVVVPGRVNKGSRNYQQLRHAIMLLPFQILPPIRLTFLGKCEEASFKKSWQKFADKIGFDLCLFDQALSPELYQQQMRTAQVVVLPLRRKVRVGPFYEEVGFSKISGGVFDAIHYQIPLVLPIFFPVEEHWRPGMFSYDGAAELAQRITSIATEKKHTKRFGLPRDHVRKMIMEVLE